MEHMIGDVALNCGNEFMFVKVQFYRQIYDEKYNNVFYFRLRK